MLRNATSRAKRVGGHGGGRRLDHDAQRDVALEGHAAGDEFLLRLGEQRARPPHLGHRDDQREHDAQVAVHAGAQQRAQLGAEDRRLVQAHADGPPPEERIRLRGKSAHGQLVAADVERANDHRHAGERFDHAPVAAVLLLLVGHGGAPHDQELRPHEPHALGPAVARRVRLFGQVDVGVQDDGHAVETHALERGQPAEFGLDHVFLAGPLAILLDLGVRRAEGNRAVGAVEDGAFATGQRLGRGAQADHRRQVQRAGEDGHVRSARAGVGGDADDGLAVELHREARGEVVGDENHARAARQVHGVVVGQFEEQREHADVHVGEVAHPLAEHRHRVAGEPLAPLEHHEVERLLGRQPLVDELLHPREELGVFEDRVLHVEDRGLLAAGHGFDAEAHLAQPLLGAVDRGVEAAHLGGNLVLRHEAVRHVGHLPSQEVNGADGDAWRGGDAGEGAVH